MKRNIRMKGRRKEYMKKKKYLKNRIKEELKEVAINMKIEKEITGGRKKIKLEEKEKKEPVTIKGEKTSETTPKNNPEGNEEKVRVIEECPMSHETEAVCPSKFN